MRHSAQPDRFRQVFDDCFDDIRAYCLRRLPPDDADEAVSVTFAVAWRRVQDLPDGNDARLWLFGVARNAINNVRRSERRRHRLTTKIGGLGGTAVPGPQAVAVERSEQRELVAALAELSDDDQEVLRLRLWEELSVAEVAVVLGCNEKAASKRYQRAVARLAKRVESTSRVRMRPHPVYEGGER